MWFDFETLIDELNEKNFNLTLENESLKGLFEENASIISEYYDLCKNLEADWILKIKEEEYYDEDFWVNKVWMVRFIEYKNNKYVIYKEWDI